MKLVEAYDNDTYRVRPTPITILCVLMFIGSVGGLFSIIAVEPVRDAWAERASWYLNYLMVLYLATLVCALGLWVMHRWAFIAYGSVIISTQGILIIAERWTPSSLILVSILAWILARYYRRTKNQNESEPDSAGKVG